MRLLTRRQNGRERAIVFALLLSCAIFILSSSALPQTATPATNWYQFRGNQQLTGLSGAANTPKTLKPLWTFDAGGSIESSAAVVGGSVFVGSHKGELVALGLDNGSVYWRYNTGREIGESSPFYHGPDELVYVGDLAGVLHAVGARDGRPAWTFKTGAEIKSSPVAVGNRVLIGSYDQHLYCLNAKTGALLWKFKTNGPVHATPAVVGGIAYIAGCDEVFRAIRVADGKELFQVASGAYTGASPAIASGSAYYGTFDNEVLAVNLRSRSVAWRYKHPERQFPFYSSAAVSGGRVVLGGRDKLVHCLSAATGKSLWTFSTRARVESSPAIAGGRVYVGSNDGRFYVLDLSSGALLWEFNAGAPLSASPGLGSGRVVIGSQDGRLYCFG
ncbi:MAG TPA: PQQ-binding-like beta-propeller repeat protein [Pyrinomonadaceae bacterium]|nr:PQQ-binding-like beta-propeller repeat protein [Pyrinomonadaceae bacterium]